MKISPYGLQRPRRIAKTRSFETPAGTLTLTFQRLLTTDYTAARAAADSLIERFVGDPDEGIEPAPFFPVGGETCSVDAVLCTEVAQLAQAQPLEIDDRYTEEELIAFANGLDPLIWVDIKKFFRETQAVSAEESRGNDSGAVTAGSSELPSATENAIQS